MRTAHSSGRLGGSPPGTPRSRHPPWEQAPPLSQEQAPPPKQSPHGTRHPPVNRMTNRSKNITLPQTSFAGGKNVIASKDYFQILNYANVSFS